MIISDFHLHTTFSDGKNSAEEMVVAAIEKGLKEMGFSEHAYEPFDDCRLEKGTEKLYRAEIARLKDKYAGKINILCGIEADYFSEDDFSLYDFVIGSVHYLKAGGKIYPIDYRLEHTVECLSEAFRGDTDALAEAYYEQVSGLYAKTGANIIGHFDIITKFENRGLAFPATDRYIKAARSAIDALKNNCAFEVNTGGVSRGYKESFYPDDHLIDYIYAVGGKAVVGSDSHSTAHITGYFDAAERKLYKAGFKELGFTDAAGVFHSQIKNA